MAPPLARNGSSPVQLVNTLNPGEYVCVVYVAGQIAKQSSPVPRVAQLLTVVSSMPTSILIPSAIVSRMRQLVMVRPSELMIHIPTLVCSIQRSEIDEPVPKDPPMPS